jgi:hypothetical protein
MESIDYYYLQHQITGEVYMNGGYMVLFMSSEEGFEFRDTLNFEDRKSWRVKKCSQHLLDQ